MEGGYEVVRKENLVVEYCPHCEGDTQHYYKEGRGWVCVSCNMTGSEGESGCLISTVVCRSGGLGSECRELQMLRNFRDSYMMETEERRGLVGDYYRDAPILVELLMRHPRKEQICRALYEQFVVRAVGNIEKGRCEEALREYSRMLEFLSRRLEDE